MHYQRAEQIGLQEYCTFIIRLETCTQQQQFTLSSSNYFMWEEYQSQSSKRL